MGYGGCFPFCVYICGGGGIIIIMIMSSFDDAKSLRTLKSLLFLAGR